MLFECIVVVGGGVVGGGGGGMRSLHSVYDWICTVMGYRV